MANYKKITDVEVMETVSENSMALVNENGVLKQVSCAAGFGASDFKTAIIKNVALYDNYISAVNPVSEESIYECLNMTFEEALQIIQSGRPLFALVMDVHDWISRIDPAERVYFDAGNSKIMISTHSDTYSWSANSIELDTMEN